MVKNFSFRKNIILGTNITSEILTTKHELISGYVHTKRDKFENTTFFYPDRPSVHTKTVFSVSAKRKFLKTLSKVDKLMWKPWLRVLVWTAKTEFFEYADVTTAMWL